MIQQLAYLRLGVEEPDAWANLLVQAIGTERRSDSVDEVSRFRIDDRHHRLALFSADQTAVDAIGLQVANRAALTQTIVRLREQGCLVEEGSAHEAQERGVLGFVRSSDPDGTPLEVCWGQHLDERPVRFGAPVSRFVAGDLGMGHVFLATKNLSRFEEFYTDVLGFVVSDYMSLDGNEIVFLHCNQRHHSVAAIEFHTAEKSPAAGTLLHFMLEAGELDDVGRIRERSENHGVPEWLTLGRHSNDHMVSFYLWAPGRIAIEVGCEGRLIDDATWQINKHFRDSFWGHREQREEDSE